MANINAVMEFFRAVGVKFNINNWKKDYGGVTFPNEEKITQLRINPASWRRVIDKDAA